MIFRLPPQLKLIATHTTLAPLYWPRDPLAYIEWFTAPMLTVAQQKHHNMATVQCSLAQVDGFSQWSIIPLSNIHQSCMLAPNFSNTSVHNQASWTSSNILDVAPSFLVNNWASVYTYRTIDKD